MEYYSTLKDEKTPPFLIPLGEKTEETPFTGIKVMTGFNVEWGLPRPEIIQRKNLISGVQNKKLDRFNRPFEILQWSNHFLFTDFLIAKELEIEVDGKIIANLPQELNAIFNSIQRSKYILELEENWDSEGAKSYKKSTWIKAIHFLVNYSKEIFESIGKIIEPPRITHGPDGSIDILWKNTNYRLLINIPADTDNIASFLR